MAGQAKAGDIGGGMGSGVEHGISAKIIELNHLGTGSAEDILWTGPSSVGRRHETGAEGFGEDQAVAGAGPCVGVDFLRMDHAGDRQAEFDLCVADCMAANDDAAGGPATFGTAFENAAQQCQIFLVVGKPDEVEGRLGRAAHRIDVAERIGCRYLAIDIRIIHDWRKKVDRLNDGEVVAEAVHSRVVVRFGADEEIGIIHLGYVAQDLRNPLRGELASSPRTGGIIQQAFLATEKQHRRSSGHGWEVLTSLVGSRPLPPPTARPGTSRPSAWNTPTRPQPRARSSRPRSG